MVIMRWCCDDAEYVLFRSSTVLAGTYVRTYVSTGHPWQAVCAMHRFSLRTWSLSIYVLTLWLLKSTLPYVHRWTYVRTREDSQSEAKNERTSYAASHRWVRAKLLWKKVTYLFVHVHECIHAYVRKCVAESAIKVRPPVRIMFITYSIHSYRLRRRRYRLRTKKVRQMMNLWDKKQCRDPGWRRPSPDRSSVGLLTSLRTPNGFHRGGFTWWDMSSVRMFWGLMILRSNERVRTWQ